MIAAAALIPFTLRQLGTELFGVLTLIWALIGYFSLFDMGVGRALTYQLSRLRIDNNPTDISQILKAGLLLTLGTGIFGALLMLLLAPSLATNWLKISLALQEDTMLSFQIAALGVIPTTITSGLRGALEGLGHFASSNINKMILGLFMFVLPALSIVIHGNHLWMITLYLVLARLLVAALAMIHFRTHLFTTSLLPNTHNIKTHINQLFNYGIWVTVTGIIGPLMVYGDRFFVSAFAGASLLPIYAIPQEGLQRLLMIPSALSGALLPQLSALSLHESSSLYWRNYKRVTVMMFGICALTALLIYPILVLWLSVDFAQKALPIALVLCLGVWLNSIALIPYTLIHAKGNPKATALFHLLEFILYIIALWWLTSHYGLIGAAWAWIVRVTLDLILLNNYANKILNSQIKNR